MPNIKGSALIFVLTISLVVSSLLAVIYESIVMQSRIKVAFADKNAAYEKALVMMDERAHQLKSGDHLKASLILEGECFQDYLVVVDASVGQAHVSLKQAYRVSKSSSACISVRSHQLWWEQDS